MSWSVARASSTDDLPAPGDPMRTSAATAGLRAMSSSDLAGLPANCAASSRHRCVLVDVDQLKSQADAITRSQLAAPDRCAVDGDAVLRSEVLNYPCVV